MLVFDRNIDWLIYHVECLRRLREARIADEKAGEAIARLIVRETRDVPMRKAIEAARRLSILETP